MTEPVASQPSLPSPGEPRPGFALWRVPLAVLAGALTAGVVLDRCASVPLTFSVPAFLASFVAWRVEDAGAGSVRPLYLVLACVAAGAAYHQLRRGTVHDNDIRRLVADTPWPVRVRGWVSSEPIFRRAQPHPLRTFPARDTTEFVLQLSHLRVASAWQPLNGLAQVYAADQAVSFHPGDVVEVTGVLDLPRQASNPGELAQAEYLADRGISVVLSVMNHGETVRLLERGWPVSLAGWLAVLRGWGDEVLDRHIAPEYSGLAKALLLGEDAHLGTEGWERYVRSGVVHVLAISGQHLVILLGFLWMLRRLAGFPYARSALAFALLIFVYALLAGGRPAVMRSAWIVLAWSLAIRSRRVMVPGNAFALAWIAVLLANPSDLFALGCQLSFLAVAILQWGMPPGTLSTLFLVWAGPEGRAREAEDGLRRLEAEGRPRWLQALCLLARWLVKAYAVNALVWLLLAPLLAGRQNLIAPVALLIGPPLIVLTSLALLTGFLTLLAAPLGLAPLFALPTESFLAACETLVHWAVALPGAYLYVPAPPAWWLFYLLLPGAFLAALYPGSGRLWLRRSVGLAAFVWLATSFALALWPVRAAEFRCTFLAVGHGGCTVLETSGGRTLVYDAGAMTGPEVSRRHIAPFLWTRRIRRIDELLLSHADLDHFNGVPDLADRFAIGQVTVTPSFSERATPGARLTVQTLRERGIPLRIARAGDRLDCDDLSLEVVHPPLEGPAGNENARSLVLVVVKDDLRILLTGDLEGAGLERVLALPPRNVDVLLAPHHGSKAANPPALVHWARPRLAVSSQGRPRGGASQDPYTAAGALYLTTWEHGAVTILRQRDRWLLETFRDRFQMPLR